MSEFSLEFLIYNLENDIAKYTENYIINMKKGIYNYRMAFSVYLLNRYLELIAQYDLRVFDVNPLSSVEMSNILLHTNIILNTNYSYEFKPNASVF